ncbi:hypothetical protein BJ166DRAFT_497991 [Pestalotiopsis sp. NC0098]|nr:hypothetical protein BJ166DRAFT_497991 [Pestalotiopsis sp. NC0098]
MSGFEAKLQNASAAEENTAQESTSQETAVAQLPGLATFRFELPRSQWLRGSDNYHMYMKKLTVAKLAAGWTQGAPLHPADDARVGFWILTTVCRGPPEDAIEDCQTGSEMEQALMRAFDPASYWNAQAKLSGLRHASLSKFRWDVWQEWNSFEYAGGDPSLFNRQWNSKLRRIEEVGHENIPCAAAAATTYLIAIKRNAVVCHDDCRDTFSWFGDDKRLGWMQHWLEVWHVWAAELRQDESSTSKEDKEWKRANASRDRTTGLRQHESPTSKEDKEGKQASDSRERTTELRQHESLTNRDGKRADVCKERAKHQCWNCDKLASKERKYKWSEPIYPGHCPEHRPRNPFTFLNLL